MKQILCFGDSNTYGYIPGRPGRYSWEQRWTGILSRLLGRERCQIIEEGICGRTTVFNDPFRDYRNGSKMLPAILETHGEVDLFVLMLGTNDCKTVYGTNAEIIGKGIERLVSQIRSYSENIRILLISPIHLGEEVWKEEFDPQFSRESVAVSKKLKDVYQKIAKKENLYFLAASDYVAPSAQDQEHLNEEGHEKFAHAVAEKINTILN